jgi:hypothetical protein
VTRESDMDEREALHREIEHDWRYLDTLRRNLSRTAEYAAEAKEAIADSLALLQEGQKGK